MQRDGDFFLLEKSKNLLYRQIRTLNQSALFNDQFFIIITNFHAAEASKFGGVIDSLYLCSVKRMKEREQRDPPAGVANRVLMR